MPPTWRSRAPHTPLARTVWAQFAAVFVADATSGLVLTSSQRARPKAGGRAGTENPTPTVTTLSDLLVYGDSITEGVLTLGGSQAADTDHNDASVVYSYALAALLGTEIGVVGFGATGLSRGGSGGVPALGESWNQLWDGVPRSFSPRPDLILFNEGTNDGSNNITAQLGVGAGPCPMHGARILYGLMPKKFRCSSCHTKRKRSRG